MASVTSRQPSGLVTAPAKRPTLAEITSTGSGLPNRYILHAVEKFGKTTFGAFTPHPIFLMTRGETGLLTLIDSGRLKETPHFPECMTWADVLGAIETLTTDEHNYRTLVIDTLNGAERLCHEEVCRRDFKSDWSERGFMNYMRGYEVSANCDWKLLLQALDKLREARRMSIMLLAHTRVKTYKNPSGADYDRFCPDMHDKTWSLSHKWADVILFGNYETFVNESDSKKKGKATSSQARFIYTERHAAYDAGNRLGLPPEIDLGNSGQEAWDNFVAALKQARTGDSNNA